MSWTYEDLIADARLELRDPSTLNNKFFTDAELLKHFVDATIELVRESGLSQITRLLTLIPSQGEYSLPCGLARVVEIRDSDGERIRPITVDALNQIDDTWPEREGEVLNYYPIRGESSNKIGFYQVPSAGATVTVRAWAIPTLNDDVAVADTPELDVMIQKKTMNYVLGKAYLKKREIAESEHFLEKFRLIDTRDVKRYVNSLQDGISVMQTNERVGNTTGLPTADSYPNGIESR